MRPLQNGGKKTLKSTETLVDGYSSESTQRELSIEYKNGFQRSLVLVFWMKVGRVKVVRHTMLLMLHLTHSCLKISFTFCMDL